MVLDVLKELVTENSYCSYSDLDVLSMPYSRNLFVTDHKTVFAKASNDNLDHEYEGALWALKHGIRTPELISPPIPIRGLDDYTDLLITEYEVLSVSPTDPRPLLTKLDWVTYPDSAVSNCFERDLAQARFHLSASDADAKTKSWLTVKLSRSFQAGKDLEAKLFRVPVFVHGDFHARNVKQDAKGEAVVLDWERWGYGNREYDLAKWIQCDTTEKGVGQDYRELLSWATANNLEYDLLATYVEFLHYTSMAYNLRFFPKGEALPHDMAALENFYL